MPFGDTPRSTLTHIGAWKLGKTLGRGAYAHVRLATHTTGHRAACKILPALHHKPGLQVSWDQTVDAIEAHKEVVLLKALAGANVSGIVGLEGVIEQGGWTYVFLELHQYSASRITPPWHHNYLAPFFRHLLHSVHSLHTLNVSHEDLKRSNILVDKYCRPYLVDFGFSHFKPFGGLVKSAGGTLDYSSPEKTADVMYDPKANDVWSLGIILLKILGFPHPYSFSTQDETSTIVKQRIIDHSPCYCFPPGATKPSGVGELITGMLERDPKKRWKIPRILRHPYLRTNVPDPKPFSVPPKNLSFMHRIPFNIVEDICFLAHLNGEFALCETTRKIEIKLSGTDPCWEKQWAGMIGAWSKRAEMEWEPIPAAITPLRAKSDPTNNRRASNPAKSATANKPQALREIHLTPNRNMQTPSRDITTALHGQHNKENIPPKRARKSRMYGMKTRVESMDVDQPEAKVTSKALAGPLQSSGQEVNARPKRNKKTLIVREEEVDTRQSETQKTLVRKRTKKIQVFQTSQEAQIAGEDLYIRSGSITLPTEGASETLPVGDVQSTEPMSISPNASAPIETAVTKKGKARQQRPKGTAMVITPVAAICPGLPTVGSSSERGSQAWHAQIPPHRPIQRGP
ncbi:CAMK/CAMKL protein kinase [Kwoniella heveanensis BCC8398]|uniref:CAMK/CAMKL protein kinase n=1 Tax=Kwoniella heveanensis BCC8398 TaxID=1296120 RepID=A0A1B9GMF3_9TREE|nr:CAMK/CAMKL protein kinase [Kwoniella heveanensis BCC8398]